MIRTCIGFLRKEIIMKKLINRAVMAAMLALLLVLCLYTLPGKTMAATSGKLTYTVSDGKATITACDPSVSGKFTIPSKLGGYPVTAIDTWAFSECMDLTSLVIPEGVTKIGDHAFYSTNISSLTIPSTLKEVGWMLFTKSGQLTELRIADLTSFLNIEFRSDTNSFEGHNYKLYVNNKLVKKLVIPEGVTSIPNRAFNSCASIQQVVLPEGLTSIGDSAFWGCSALSTITLPDSLTYVGQSAFGYCDALKCTVRNNGKYLGNAKNPCLLLVGLTSTNVKRCTIPAGTKVIAQPGFRNYSALKQVIVNENNACFSSDEAGVLYNKDKTVLYWAPRTLKGSYTVASTVKKIDDWAFDRCESLTEVVLPKKLTEIGRYAFWGCKKLQKLELPNSLLHVGQDAFYGCHDKLFKTTYTGTYLGNKNNPYLLLVNADLDKYSSTFTVPNGTRIIDYNVFIYEKYVQEINFGDNVTVIGRSAFDDCDRLQKLVLPNSLKIIKKWAFYGCDNLTSIRIPEGTHTIEDQALSHCISLKNIQLPSTITQITYGMLSSCTSLTQVELPKNVQSIDRHAFANCTALESIVINAQVKEIGKGAFENCPALKNVYFTGTQQQWKKIVIQENNEALKNAKVHFGYKIITQPRDQAVLSGKTAKFTVKTKGTGLKYQWQFKPASGGSWKNATATGSKTATLSIPATASRNGYQYRCKITDTAKKVIYTRTVSLKVLNLRFKKHPVSATAFVDASQSFRVTAVGQGLSYQWQYRNPAVGKWVNAGSQGDVIYTDAKASKNGFQYRCQITDDYGNVMYSNAATLNVIMLKINKQPVSANLPVGQTAVFSVQATGTGLSYQWQFCNPSSSKWYNAKVEGSTTASLSVPVSE